MGFAVTLAIVVAMAHLGSYLFGLDELFGWRLLPILIGAAAGFRLGRKRPHSVAWAAACGLGALLIGTLLGWFLGAAVSPNQTGPWSGAVLGGATGLLAGTVVSLRISRVPRHPLITATAAGLVFIGVFLFAVFGAARLLDLDPVEFPVMTAATLPAPSEVDAVVFLVGDAGGAEAGRSPLIAALQAEVERWARALRGDSAVSVLFLGDNVYPQGVHDPGTPEFNTDSVRLWSQVSVVSGPEAKRRAALGLFVAGNHDWGNSTGDAGLGRLRNQEQLLTRARERGPRVALLPASGDPGPVYRDLRRNVRLIFFDTHWFLQDRSPQFQAQFFARMHQTLAGAGDREVILVAHHPYHSAGPHGVIMPGYHTLGIGYVLKQAGALVQDLNSPIYDELLVGLRRTFDLTGKPPLVYAGGHDHSLQVLSGSRDFDPRFVLVSGAGSRLSSIRLEPGLVWGASQPGFMALLFRKDDGVDLFVVAGDPASQQCAGEGEALRTCMQEQAAGFSVVYSVSLLGPSGAPRALNPVIEDTTAPATPWWTEDTGPLGELAGTTAPALEAARTLATADSFTTVPGRSYPASRFQQFFSGSLYRKLWSLPVRLPVLDLRQAGGGLTPLELTGGKQTIGLRFNAEDGLQYEFRPIVKNPEPVLPGWMRDGAIGGMLDDQMAAQLPFGSLVVSRLQEAAAIEAPRPAAMVMPNDPRLAQFRALFAGRIGLFSVHADERGNGEPGFGGYREIVGSDDFYDALDTRPGTGVDDRYFLRIRLLDLLVGDWDRHSGQWRWGRRGDQWRPIPEDRDWAFPRINGVLGWLAGLMVPRYVGFSAEYPDVERLTVQSDRVDHRVLNRLRLVDFTAVARELQAALTDSVIASAVAALPAAYLPVEGPFLEHALKARRDALVEYSAEFYRHVVEEIRVYGHRGIMDVVTVDQVTPRGARLQLRAPGPNGPVRFERVVSADETERVVLMLEEGDRVLGDGEGVPFELERRERETSD